MRYAPALVATLSLVLLGACGGGGSSQPAVKPFATSLSYQNPTGSGGYSLVLDAASTPTQLVLDLLGPSGTPIKGVAFGLTADSSKVAWVSLAGAGGAWASPGTVLPLGNAPQLFTTKLSGGQLQVGLFQKGGAATTLGSAPILSLALGLANASVATGAVALAPASGMLAQCLGADGTLSTITIATGTLTAM